MVAAAMIGSAVVGAAVSGSAAEDAEDAQHDAAQNAAAQGQESLALQARMYDEGVQRGKPFYDTGVAALGKLNSLLGLGGQAGTLPTKFEFDSGDLANDPAYQFRQQQGQRALDRRQAAGGGFYSGAGLQEAAKFNSDLASTEFDNAYTRGFNAFQNERANTLNPLLSLLDKSQMQANQTNAAGQNFANASSGVTNSLMGLTTGMGNATGAAGMAQSNALINGLNGGLSAWQRAKYMNGGNGLSGLQSSFSQTGLGSSGFGSGLAYGNQDLGGYY